MLLAGASSELSERLLDRLYMTWQWMMKREWSTTFMLAISPEYRRHWHGTFVATVADYDANLEGSILTVHSRSHRKSEAIAVYL